MVRQLDIQPVREHDTCVARVPIFRDLTRQQQNEVAAFARPIKADKGAVLQTPSATQNRLMVVHTGRIRVVHVLENGREQVVRVLEPGDVMGETSFLLGRRPEHFAFADQPVALCTFDHADLARLVSTYPDIAVRMLQAATERLLSAERMLAAFSSTEVMTRVAAYLLDLPAIMRGGQAQVSLPMAKKDVASYLGTTPETLSRRLAELVDEGVIEMSGRRGVAIVDVDRLSELATP
ncbi:Crp/Fnr family transcriptional regulator [Aestuariimicrobium ganziense]|uniref:Crp/Fnr family transcriptional regulator n=1 Tax=Aestuariimicrobium ganziense TaxID=2773677 RepID=UPI002E2C5E97|nr:Crp/Fnr family transcriptional regulator [Aestuariimicrobium ganziense]